MNTRGVTWFGFAIAVTFGSITPRPANAQLISPGRLSSPHADLEGVRNCTQCHRLRERGIAPDLCLACHEVERARIDEHRGFHATLTGRDCADCHKEHFGVEFALIRFDTAAFVHDTVGYRLEGRHAELGCRDCHRASRIVAEDVRQAKATHGALDRTYLGLGTACAACHRDDDPHGAQFAGRACTDCHTQVAWEGAERFSHERTAYALTGRHQTVECAGCHRQRGTDPASVRWAGLQASRCTDCHRDPHEARMGADCTRCHTTEAWRALSRSTFERDFDHATTGYRLEGAHARLECAACHTPNAGGARNIRLTFAGNATRRLYPPPAAEACQSCHADYHDGVFLDASGGPECRNCHSQLAWLPTSYDLARHNAGDTYRLTGAHAATPCSTCHRDPQRDALRFQMEHDACLDCHGATDPHGAQFAGRACDECHGTESFHIASFDHGQTRYPLDGRHADVRCEACHVSEPDTAGRPVRRYRPLGTRCEDCHGGGA